MIFSGAYGKLGPVSETRNFVTLAGRLAGYWESSIPMILVALMEKKNWGLHRRLGTPRGSGGQVASNLVFQEVSNALQSVR